MLREEITRRIQQAAHEAQAAGELPAVALPDVQIERPQRPENGDYATSLPLRLKKAAGGPGSPLEIARAIAARVQTGGPVREAVAAPPGFVNIFIDERWLQAQVDAIVA